MHATTLPAALYLTLSRFLARRYADVCKLADLCVSESQPTPEEAQLWCAFAGVANDPSPDACAARLRLSVAAYGTPAESLLPWRWSPSSRSTSPRGDTSAPTADSPRTRNKELLEACSAEGMKAPLMPTGRAISTYAPKSPRRGKIRTTRTTRTIRTGARAPWRTRTRPRTAPSTRWRIARAWRRGSLGEGPSGSLAGLKHSFVQYEERELTGAAGLRMIGEWLDQGSFALDGAHGFPLLFELLTGTVPLRVLPTDEPHRWGAALLRFVPPEQSLKRGTLMSVLRALASSKFLADQAPKVEERGMSARMAAVFTQDGAIGMLPAACVQPFLRERFGDLPAAFLERTPRTGRRKRVPTAPRDGFAGRDPGTRARSAVGAPEVLRTRRARRRAFPLTHHLGGDAWGGPNLDAVDVAALADAPLSQLGLEKFFENPGASSAEKEKDAERARVRALASASAKNEHAGGLPFAVAQHAAAATPIARQTLARLRADVKGRGNGIRAKTRARESESRRRPRERARARSLPQSGSTRRTSRRCLPRRRAPSRARRSTRSRRARATRSKARAEAVDAADAGGGRRRVRPRSRRLRSILGARARSTSADRAAAAEAAAAAASVANGLSRDPGAARSMLRLGLNRRSGAWAEATFDDLVEGFLCDGAERVLARVTPGVGEKGAARRCTWRRRRFSRRRRAAQSARGEARRRTPSPR